MIQPTQTQRQHKYKDTAQTNIKAAQGFSPDRHKNTKQVVTINLIKDRSPIEGWNKDDK
jgi:hypothetical protein